MTPREIVRELEMDGRKRETARVFFDNLENQIDDAIFAAILAEREACAELARKAAGNHPNELKRETARDIEALILARSTASNGGER